MTDYRLYDLGRRIDAAMRFHGFTKTELRRARIHNQMERFRQGLHRMMPTVEEFGKAAQRAVEAMKSFRAACDRLDGQR